MTTKDIEAKDDLISRRGVVERLREVARGAFVTSQEEMGYDEHTRAMAEGRESLANALADEFAAADSGEMRTTTSGHSPVVDQSHLKLDADQRIVHPLLAQLLTTWTCMVLDYNGTVNRMKDAGRPHDAARYEAKMETLSWCSRELTAVAKRLPNTITQDSASASELATTLPDHSQASSLKSSSSSTPRDTGEVWDEAIAIVLKATVNTNPDIRVPPVYCGTEETRGAFWTGKAMTSTAIVKALTVARDCTASPDEVAEDKKTPSPFEFQ